VVTVAYYALVNLGSHRVSATDARMRHGSLFVTFRLASTMKQSSRRRFNALRARCAMSPSPSNCYRRCSHSPNFSTFTKRSWKPLWTNGISAKDSFHGPAFETEQIEQDVAHRAARLYRFDESKYKQLKKKGFNFEL
jgi:8-oxo-dGTP diphosphatase